MLIFEMFLTDKVHVVLYIHNCSIENHLTVYFYIQNKKICFWCSSIHENLSNAFWPFALLFKWLTKNLNEWFVITMTEIIKTKFYNQFSFLYSKARSCRPYARRRQAADHKGYKTFVGQQNTSATLLLPPISSIFNIIKHMRDKNVLSRFHNLNKLTEAFVEE